MEARPCPIAEFFNGTKQMLVPLFQRSYEWGPKEWDVLWDDILEQYEHNQETATASHFTGAIVTAPARSVPVGVSKFLVIDGQQRLTTVAVLICALRSFLDPAAPKYRKLTSLLLNEHDEGLDHYKLLPTQPDRAAYKELVDGGSASSSRFGQAYGFFKEKIMSSDSDGSPIDLDRLIDAINNRITVVAIHLGDADDPYLIFESLNAKGAPLTQADLIRNYLLLRLHANEQQQIYESAWLPMQSRLPGEHLTEFMRQYLMLSGEEVGKSSIYAVLKKRLASMPDVAVADELRRLLPFSALYAQIIGLQEAAEPAVQKGLIRLRRWDVATANTFLLKLLAAHSDGHISGKDVASCLSIIESFVVRRAVCGVPTNQLKRIFLALTKDFRTEDFITWLDGTLATGTSGRRWPKDEEFREWLSRYRAYAQPLDRCKFILESIERSYGHKEEVHFSSATIEHVMPQTMSDHWITALGSDWMAVHERWIDLLGNLTLTGYNSELSNAPFAEKRELLAESNFEMNKWISDRGSWTESAIRDRTDELYRQAIQVWKRPNDLAAIA